VDINEYYRQYFYNRKSEMDYPIKKGGTIYDLLAKNERGCGEYRNSGNTTKVALRSAIRSASDEFFVIAPGQTSVIVPYGKSKKLVDKYVAESDIDKKRKHLCELGRYSVSLYKYQIDELSKHGALYELDGLTILSDGFYDDEFGINLEGNHEFLNV
jgi:CRISPR-associated endonuclease/helicase Cas3